MPRTPPTIDVPTPSFQLPESFTVNLQTITPMFGGSALTREVDRDHPVRAASVRGHLRFWWRATAGAQFKTAEELFKAEAEIWGSAEQHGAVRVEVLNQEADSPRVPQLARELIYATFPFQEQRASRDNPGMAAASATSASFTLRLTCPAAHLSQIKTAAQAWVMFGGIGSRTRRGCGSLKMADGVLPSLTFPGRGAQMLTTLPGSYFLGKPQSDSVKAWAEAVKVYSDFRQGDGIARTSSVGRPSVNGKKAPPGRSFWPEPDTIRRLRDKFYDGTDRDGQYKRHEPQHTLDGFPRADLGLPITFHFKDEGTSRKHDPTDQELRGKGEGKMRFSSPIITKVIEVNGQYMPLVMIMDSPHVWEGGEVVLAEKKSRDKTISSVPVNQLQAIQSESPQNGKPIREAFRLFVASRQVSEKDKSSFFTEVRL